jgi:hypothetical protein
MNLRSTLTGQRRIFCVFNEPTDKETPMPIKGPTSDSDWKPSRSQDGADVGGHQRPSRDISKDVEKWSKVRGGRSGKC